MENYQFQRHNFSKDEIKQAADSNLEIKDLGILSYNTENKLQILEHRASGKNAKYDDLVSAVKLYDNVIKMSKEKRAKVDYENLRSRAQNVYTTLADSLAKPESIEAVVEAQPTEVVHTNPVSYAGMLGSTEKKGLLSRIGDYFHTVPSRAAGRVRTVYIAAIAALALAPALWAGYNLFYRSLPKNPDVVTQENIKPAPVTTAPVKVPDAKSLADQTQQQTKVPEVNPFAEKPAAPQTDPAPYAGQRPSQDRASEAAKENQETEANLESLREAARKVVAERKAAEAETARKAEAERQKLAETARKTAELDRQRKEAERKAAEAKARENTIVYTQPEPTEAYRALKGMTSPAPAQQAAPASADYKPIITGEDPSLKGILYVKGIFDNDTTGVSASAKGILELGKATGLDLYLNGFDQVQKFDEGDIAGYGERVQLGLHTYPVLSKGFYGFLEGGVMAENRDFAIKPENGSNYTFGNKGFGGYLKLGLTQAPIDDDDVGVANRHNFVIFQAAGLKGDVKGDAGDEYTGDFTKLMTQLQGRLMLNDSFSVEAGMSTLNEKLGEFLSQNNIYGDAGVRWHFDAAGTRGYIEALGLVQRLDSEFTGTKDDETRFGGQVGAGVRLLNTKDVKIDFKVDGAVLHGDKTEWIVTPGIVIYGK